jgi:hypothetical protein
MSDNGTSSIIEKVQKLLSLSKSSNANEAAAAANAANKLIDQYRLSTADLESSTETVEPVEEDDGYIYQSGRINPWKSRLVSVLVNHYGLASWNDADYSSGRMVTRVRLVGRRSDITIARYMFAWLTAECQRLSDNEAKGKGRVYVNSYCIGFVNGISTQLKSSRAEVQKEATSSAIIKIDARSEEAKGLMYRLHNLRSAKTQSHSRLDGAAFAAGKSKGEAMHLGSSLGAGGTKLLGR